MAGRLPPTLVIIAGPNGAGKSTAAPALLRDVLGITTFVNTDVIARGLSGFNPQAAATEASRIMLARIRELARGRVSFGFETTLASRSLLSWIRSLLRDGYQFHLMFLWLRSAEIAVARVAERVRSGGHGIAEQVVRQRYVRGLWNFFHLYRPLATTWRFYDNSGSLGPRLVAAGQANHAVQVYDPDLWSQVSARDELQKID